MNYIFDLFGTLVKTSREEYERIMQSPFSTENDFYKNNIREFISTNNFTSSDEALDALLKQIDKPLNENQKSDFFSQINTLKKIWAPYENVFDTLKELKQQGSKICIVSNASKFIEEVIEIVNVDKYVDFIIMSHKVGLLKPDKRIYLLAAKKLNSRPENITMIGDQLEKDVLAPIKLGMQGILFDPENKDTEYKGKKITSFKELLQI